MAKRLINTTIKLGRGTLDKDSLMEFVRGGYASVPLNNGSETIQGNTWYKGSVDIVFDPPMLQPPRIGLATNSSGPMYATASVTGVSRYGFTLNLHRINTVATGVHWVAIAVY